MQTDYLDEMSEIDSQAIRDVYDDWRRKCLAGAVPRRAEIDPVDLRPHLPNLMVVEFEDPFRVRDRLVGTKVVEMTGLEITGRYLDEIAIPDDLRNFTACYRRAAEERRPIFARILWHFADGYSGEYDLCVLPLSNDGTRVDMALVLESYEHLEHHYHIWRAAASKSG